MSPGGPSSACRRGERGIELDGVDGHVRLASGLPANLTELTVSMWVRPDTIVILGQFDHWATPYIKDQERASLNTVAPMSIELTDATGSGADIVRVSVRRMDKAAASRKSA